MANPQREHGHTEIANELMEALARFRIPGEVRQVLDAIIRKTYGWNKKTDKIPVSQLVKMTGLHKANVSRSLSKLITNRIVIKTDNNFIGLQKNYEEWQSFKVIKVDNKSELSKLITPVIKVDNAVIKTDNKKLSRLTDSKETTKDTYSKDTLQKTPHADLKIGGELATTVNGFIGLFQRVNPSYEQLFQRKPQRDAAQRMIEKHGMEPMTKLIEQLPRLLTDRYAPKATTPVQLEEKLGQILMYFKNKGARHGSRIGSI